MSEVKEGNSQVEAINDEIKRISREYPNLTNNEAVELFMLNIGGMSHLSERSERIKILTSR